MYRGAQLYAWIQLSTIDSRRIYELTTLSLSLSSIGSLLFFSSKSSIMSSSSLHQLVFFGLHCIQAVSVAYASPTRRTTKTTTAANNNNNVLLVLVMQYLHPAWYVLAGVAEHYPNETANKLHDILLPIAVLVLFGYFGLHIYIQISSKKKKNDDFDQTNMIMCIVAPIYLIGCGIGLALIGNKGVPQETFEGQFAAYQDPDWIAWHYVGHFGANVCVALPALATWRKSKTSDEGSSIIGGDDTKKKA